MKNRLINNIPFSEYEARIKLMVLSYSLTFEKFASSSLIMILNLNKQAVSIGNTNKALAMHQKVQLMLDTKFFNKDDTAKIMTFMSIRNQFMHNSAAKSFESCLSFLTGTEKFIKDAYLKNKTSNEEASVEKADDEINNQELLPYDVSDKEKLLFKCFISLSADVIGGFEKVFNKVSEERKIIKKGEDSSIIISFPSED